jgi:hypothetical protein
MKILPYLFFDGRCEEALESGVSWMIHVAP